MMKNILIIIQSLAGGGAEKVLIDILKNFDTDKYKLNLCLIDEQGVYLKDVPQNIRLLYYPHFPVYRIVERLCRKIRLTSLYYFVECIFFRKFIRTKYDVIISFMEGPSLRYHSFIFDRSKKNISWVHTNLNQNHWSLYSFKSSKQEEQLYNMLSEIVFVSKNAKIEFNKLFKVTKPVQQVIYNLIDRNNIKHNSEQYNVEKRKFTICCIGRFIFEKRFDKAINVVKILIDRGFDLELWILGTGPLHTELKNQINLLNLTNRVKLWGFIKNPYPIMNKADLFLVTSDTEGYSLVTAEAICLGLPVVSTNITGPSEILDNGRYGILTSFQAIEIANILEDLISNPQKLKNLSQLSLERSEVFDSQNTMLEIYKLLENIR